MKRNLLKLKNVVMALLLLSSMIILESCEKTDDSLAPYAGSPEMSKINIEDSTYTPRITWVGGYATVIGVNRGSHAALDSTLVWLVYSGGNNIHYPVKFGQLPSGAQDLTSQYGGTTIPQLQEDNDYTYWIMKEDVWNQVKTLNNKIIALDTTLASGVVMDGDTVKVAGKSLAQLNANMDIYIGIYDISSFGRLGTISVEQTDTSNAPVIKWTITQTGVADTMIAAIGIVEGNQYAETGKVWEVYADKTEEQPAYGKFDVIPAPVYAGYEIPGTFVFTPFPASGLERNKQYYIWITSKDWDGTSRTRATNYYAYATFKTR